MYVHTWCVRTKRRPTTSSTTTATTTTTARTTTSATSSRASSNRRSAFHGHRGGAAVAKVGLQIHSRQRGHLDSGREKERGLARSSAQRERERKVSLGCLPSLSPASVLEERTYSCVTDRWIRQLYPLSSSALDRASTHLSSLTPSISLHLSMGHRTLFS